MNSKDLKRWRVDSPQRMRELRAFARQYNDWVSKLEEISVLSIPEMDGLPHGSSPGNPTESIAMQREVYQAKISVVDYALRLCSDDENVRKAVKLNVTSMGMSYNTLKQIV